MTTSREPIPPPVWALTIVWGIVLLGYTVLLPAYRAPDEPQHVDLIVAMRSGEPYPDFDERIVSPAVRSSLILVDFDERSRNLTASGATPRAERPSFAALEGALPPPTADELERKPQRYRNWIAQHPPTYYLLLGQGLNAVPGTSDWPFDRVVGFLRICNALMLLPLPAIIFATARRIGCSRTVGVAASVIPLTIPQLAHIGGSVNNDNLLVLFGAVLTWLVARVMGGDVSTRTAVLIGVTGALALLTKGFALFIPPWIVVAYLVAARRAPERRAVLARGALSVGSMVVLGGWWWVRNLVVFGTLQPSVMVDAIVPRTSPDFVPQPGWWMTRFGAFMTQRTWGSFGWLEVELPLGAIGVATAVVLFGVVVALVRRDREGLRGPIVVLLLPTVMLLAIVAVLGWRAYLLSGKTPGLQGRYLFAGLVGLAVAVGQGLTAAFRSRGRATPIVLLVGAVAMHVLAFRAIAPLYWGDTTASLTERLGALAAWAPWPAGVLGIGVVALAAATVWAFVELAIVSRVSKHTAWALPGGSQFEASGMMAS